MLRIGSVQLASPLLLAPIAGYCDLAFRLIVRSIPGHDGQASIGLACTDLLCPQGILRETDTTLWLAATCPEDRPLGMQLYGNDAHVMAQAAQWAAHNGADLIDINMGCPVDKVTKKNGGSMLLCDPKATTQLARTIVDAVDVPVTAKIRLGWDDSSIITTSLPVMLADQGIAAVTVHGRTTEQKFRGQARLVTDGDDCIAAVVRSMAQHHPQVPVIGNGDVKTPEDVKRMIDVTGCQGVMIGRGALGQPWLFRDAAHYLATGALPPPLSQVQRVQLVIDHFENMVRFRDQRYAMSKIRSRISWYSPHLQPWPRLKRDIQPMRSADQVRAFFHAKLEQLQALNADSAAPADEAAVNQPLQTHV